MNWFKQFLLGIEFIEKAIEDAERRGGIKAFPMAQKDILETMADDMDKRSDEMAKKKLNDLLSPIDLNAVVTLNKQVGAIFIGGQRVDESRLINLKSEAEFIANSELWHLLQETPKKLAEQAMFVAGEGLDDMKKGRSILYTLSSQRNIVDTFKAYVPKPLAPSNKNAI